MGNGCKSLVGRVINAARHETTSIISEILIYTHKGSQMFSFDTNTSCVRNKSVIDLKFDTAGANIAAVLQPFYAKYSRYFTQLKELSEAELSGYFQTLVNARIAKIQMEVNGMPSGIKTRSYDLLFVPAIVFQVLSLIQYVKLDKPSIEINPTINEETRKGTMSLTEAQATSIKLEEYGMLGFVHIDKGLSGVVQGASGLMLTLYAEKLFSLSQEISPESVVLSALVMPSRTRTLFDNYDFGDRDIFMDELRNVLLREYPIKRGV